MIPRMMRLLPILLLASGMGLHLTAQEAEEELVLDLQGAIDHAIAYNMNLENARLEVDRSKAQVWESISRDCHRSTAPSTMRPFSTMNWNFPSGAVISRPQPTRSRMPPTRPSPPFRCYRGGSLQAYGR